MAVSGCGGATGSGTPNALPPSDVPTVTTTTQSVPADGALAFAIAPNLGLNGSVAFPLVPGTPGTATLVASTAPVAGLPVLGGPPLDPQPVEYLCVSFSVHQIPVAAPALTLTAATPSGTAPSGVGFAYYAVYSNIWDQRYGLAAFAPSMHFVTSDSVYYRADRTCFALYLTSVTPLPA